MMEASDYATASFTTDDSGSEQLTPNIDIGFANHSTQEALSKLDSLPLLPLVKVPPQLRGSTAISNSASTSTNPDSSEVVASRHAKHATVSSRTTVLSLAEITDQLDADKQDVRGIMQRFDKKEIWSFLKDNDNGPPMGKSCTKYALARRLYEILPKRSFETASSALHGKGPVDNPGVISARHETGAKVEIFTSKLKDWEDISDNELVAVLGVGDDKRPPAEVGQHNLGWIRCPPECESVLESTDSFRRPRRHLLLMQEDRTSKWCIWSICTLVFNVIDNACACI